MGNNKIKEVRFVASQEYEKNIPAMLETLNDRMIKLNEEFRLIGENPVSVMLENHENHAKFITNVLKLNDFEMLKKTLVWVVGSYRSRGFQAEYFQYQLNNWIDILNEHLEPNYSTEIIKVYEFIKDEVKRIEKEERKEEYHEYPFDNNWLTLKKEFTRILLDGKNEEAISFAKKTVHDKKSLKEFYVKVLTYAMYEIGNMWQHGRISVAQEHLATSIVMRVMATVYLDFILMDYNKGKAIVSSAANEYHEVGVRVVSDILELDGWDVKYLGANIPNDELIQCIKEEKPVFIGLSVTMAYNLNKVKMLIEKIRADEEIKDIKILLGGLSFNYSSEYMQLGADVITNNTEDMIQTTREWWKKENVN